VISERGDTLGVVVAGADSIFDGASGPVAFAIRMTDIYTALAKAIPRAKPRMLLDTENAILRHRRDNAGDDNLAGLWSFYAADIINRSLQSIGLIDPPHLIIDDMPSLHGDSDLRPFLVLGKVFPCDIKMRRRLHIVLPRRWALRAMGVSKRTIGIWTRLLEYERGENFLILLGILGQLGNQHKSDTQSQYMYPVQPTQLPLSTLLAPSWFLQRRNPKSKGLPGATIRALLRHSDLPEMTRPGSGLINDLARLAGAALVVLHHPPWDQFRIRDEDFASAIAGILAKASYAERHACFFVYQGSSASSVRSLLTCFCPDRPLSLCIDGKISSFAIETYQKWDADGTPPVPHLFVGNGLDGGSPPTARLIRCPELYEHLRVTKGFQDTSISSIDATPDISQQRHASLETRELLESKPGSKSQSGPISQQTEILSSEASHLKITENAHHYYGLHPHNTDQGIKSSHDVLTSSSDKVIHHPHGSFEEPQLTHPKREAVARGILSTGNTKIVSMDKSFVEIIRNEHHYHMHQPTEPRDDAQASSAKEEKE
jgi:hypothetical protein